LAYGISRTELDTAHIQLCHSSAISLIRSGQHLRRTAACVLVKIGLISET